MNTKQITAVMMALAFVLGACVMIPSDDSSAAGTSGNTYQVILTEKETYSYAPAYSISNVQTEISGSATDWLSVENGVISGTAPEIDTPGSYAEYELTITAKTFNPTQVAHQYVKFRIYDTVSLTVDSDVYTYKGGEVSITPTSNFTSGVTWTLTGAPEGISVDSNTGVIYGTVLSDGTDSGKNVKAELTVTNDATGTAISKAIMFHVYSKITIDCGSDMYIVSGKDVPTSGDDFFKLSSNHENVKFYAKYLPSGLILNEDGTFSGKVTETGDYTVVLAVVDQITGDVYNKDITIHVVKNLDFDSTPTGGIIVMPA